jgi:hypothetical protein
MAVSYVGTCAVGTTTSTIAAHAVDDLIVLDAYFAGNGLPTAGAGYTSYATVMNGTALGSRVGYLFALSTSDTSGTWTGSAAINGGIYRGAGMPGAYATNVGSSASVDYPALTLSRPGQSWVMRCAAHLTATNMHLGSLTGFTFRVGANGIAAWDSNGPVSSVSAGSQSVNASSTWIAWTIEIPPITALTISTQSVAVHRASLY